MNFKRIFARGLVLPVFVLIAGCIASAWLTHMAGVSEIFASLDSIAPWGILAGLGAFLLLTARFYWRLHRWEKGHDQSCQYCGGPLGGVHEGKVMYGKQLSNYRNCYNCGRSTPEI